MRITCIRCSSSRSGSSSRWLARARNDPFSPRLSTQYIARSAHKLLELDDKYKFLRGSNKTVLELGASPGGWTQVCLERLRKGKVIAVDLKPLDGRVTGHEKAQKGALVEILGDAREQSVLDRIQGELATLEGGTVDIVLSDMLANTTGNSLQDTQASLDLCELVYSLAERYLVRASPPNRDDPPEWQVQPDASSNTTGKAKREVYTGTLIMKILQSNEADVFRKNVLSKSFRHVKWEKPASSRNESKEGFLVCRGFQCRS